jgi:hypothetical protein
MTDHASLLSTGEGQRNILWSCRIYTKDQIEK